MDLDRSGVTLFLARVGVSLVGFVSTVYFARELGAGGPTPMVAAGGDTTVAESAGSGLPRTAVSRSKTKGGSGERPADDHDSRDSQTGARLVAGFEGRPPRVRQTPDPGGVGRCVTRC